MVRCFNRRGRPTNIMSDSPCRFIISAGLLVFLDFLGGVPGDVGAEVRMASLFRLGIFPDADLA